MSEEDINFDLSLGTPNSSQPPSTQQPVQESRNNSQIPSPAPQESRNTLQRPSPAPQESSHGGHSPAVQESVHRPPREFEFIPPAGQESIHGGQTQLSSPAVQESPHGGQLQRVYRPRPQYRYVPLPVLESLYGGQSQPLSRPIQESVNYRGQLHLSPEALQFFKHIISQGLPQIVQSLIQSPSLNVSSLLPPPPPPQETQPEQEIRTIHPWEQSPAKLHTLEYILSKNINIVSGEIMCKTCKTRVSLEYKLTEKFGDVCTYLKESVKQLGQRVSEEWLKPELGHCGECGKDTLKPVISEKNVEINWLFLMLGQMLGCCNVNQLTYFCHQNSQQIKGNKACLVYIVYVVICKQLDPTLDFEL